MNIDHLQTKLSVAPERVAELEARWDNSLKYIKSIFYPHSLEHGTAGTALSLESQLRFHHEPDMQLLIGIAGPGAAGKGTIGRHLVNNLGYEKVVNTTTRGKREGEIEGADYFFTDRREFTTKENLGHFALSLERIGRGMYGISHEEIARKLSAAQTGCIVEENPANLMQLFDNIKTQNTQAVLLYILPKHPIVKHSLERLEHRLSLESDPEKRILTPEVFESTLGDRQIDEFLALSDLPNHPAITPLFIVNDGLEETKTTLNSLLGSRDATN